jgi:hypothetical protein
MKLLVAIVIAIIFQSITFTLYIEKNILQDSLVVSQRQPTSLCQNGTIHDSDKSQQTKLHTSRDAVLILASIPIDKRRIVSLWSGLECFVGSASHVVVSSAYWAKPIVDRVLVDVRNRIPHFSSREVTIEARFFDNERYDVGLWCDALQGFNTNDKYEDVILLNDSIFALRKFDGILDALRSNNYSMASLVHNTDEEGRLWLESVFRGFNGDGLSVFMNHSCVPQTHESFCKTLHRKSPNKRKTVQRLRKRCITEYHEVAMARQFSQPEKQTVGVYNGTVPEHLKSKNTSTFPTWVLHAPYWKEILIKEQNFPAAKVNQDSMIATLNDPLIGKCTMHMDQSLLRHIDFTLVERSIKYK